MARPKIEATPERIAKLPVWVQEHIRDLERRGDNATAKARQLSDKQTVTNIWVEDYGAELGHQREYVQGESIVMVGNNVCLRVDTYRDGNLDLSWSEGTTPYGGGEVALIPTAHQQARLVAWDRMYTSKNRPKQGDNRRKIWLTQPGGGL